MLNLNRSAYEWRMDGDDVIVITDLKGFMSVTNDAENVIARLVAHGIDVDRHAIIYRDSFDTWGLLLTEGGRFSGFGRMDLRREEEAVAVARYLAKGRQP
jgi:hypothetical protein